MSILQQTCLNVSKDEMVTIGMAGIFHDIGKIKVPAHILNVPRKLTEEEMAIIKGHPKWGEEFLSIADEGSVNLSLGMIRRNILEHHENYDGSGYPYGKKGNDTHLYSKIIAIADFYDAITTKRSYAERLCSSDAIELIARSAGKKVDPIVLSQFQDNLGHILGPKLYQRELEDDFDPCCYYVELPFKKHKPTIIQSDVLKGVRKRKVA
jgi:HD-GYP domain-containing protein (c-di-GMP phosphodiesterase class II)